MIDGERVKAMVAILRTKGCWWSKSGGCSMCGYNVESTDVSVDDLKAQLAQAARSIRWRADAQGLHLG